METSVHPVYSINIANLRHAYGISQAALCKLLGWSGGRLKRLEGFKTMPLAQHIHEIVSALAKLGKPAAAQLKKPSAKQSTSYIPANALRPGSRLAKRLAVALPSAIVEGPKLVGKKARKKATAKRAKKSAGHPAVCFEQRCTSCPAPKRAKATCAGR